MLRQYYPPMLRVYIMYSYIYSHGAHLYMPNTHMIGDMYSYRNYLGLLWKFNIKVLEFNDLWSIRLTFTMWLVCFVLLMHTNWCFSSHARLSTETPPYSVSFQSTMLQVWKCLLKLCPVMLAFHIDMLRNVRLDSRSRVLNALTHMA